MFGMGAQELLLILVIVLLLFGARRIPEIARGMGRAVSEFKKGVREIDAETRQAADAANEDDSKPKG